MRIDVLTLFPGIFESFFEESILALAREAGQIDIRLHNIRDWTKGPHSQVDDRPFGGGPGMVLKVEPVVESVEAVQTEAEPGHLIMMCPQGKTLRQEDVERLARLPRLVLLCGRYEGFDERVRQILSPEEISIGDYILNGGEVAAMVVIEAVLRLLPGVLGHERSNVEDSHSGQKRLLEHAQYTRPREYRGLEVPEILLSGDHGRIAKWREEDSQRRTRERRPDLLDP